jgi:hypothetical protein
MKRWLRRLVKSQLFLLQNVDSFHLRLVVSARLVWWSRLRLAWVAPWLD